MDLHAKQNGVTVLEILVVLLILSFAIVGASTLVDNYTQQMRLSLDAQQMSQFGNAVQAYIKDNYQFVANNSASPTPMVINADTLRNTNPTNGLPVVPAGKYLLPGFKSLNSYSETICALVLKPSGSTPTLAALVVTENGTVDPVTGTVINDVDLGQLAGLIGAAGGGIYVKTPSAAIAPNVAMGTMGKWAFNITSSPVGTYPVDPVGQYYSGRSRGNCTTGTFGSGTVTLTPGHPLMALWFNNDTSSAYLYRNQVPGQPQLNSMQTNLVFDNNANGAVAATSPLNLKATVQLNNIAVYPTIGAALKNIAVDDVCGYSASVLDYTTSPPTPLAIQLGTLGTDANGAVLSCQIFNGANVWEKQDSMFWGDPVVHYTDLPTCDPNTNLWQTRIVEISTVPAAPNSVPRAYTCDGTKWQPLAVDDHGVLQLGSTGTARIAGDTCTNPGLVSMNSNGQLLTCSNDNDPNFNFGLRWIGPAGNYNFRIYNFSSDPMIGVGIMKTINGQAYFTGTLHCDPTVTYNLFNIPSQSCGSGGTMICPSAQYFPTMSKERCAHDNAMASQPTWSLYNSWDYYGYSTMPLNIDVVNLRVVQPITQTW